ncbi:MAG: toprim domain-containing protein [Theionarchaea archaeon]|nr:toprim domain-containing protein [Theionarchaea archaeon]MBU7001094.1 toprim domain-containing protein [Theionarchaea archaeon]MBU7020583.1 toprim domain-containing protein [Theionarchaea archaeon]MBU7034232.1 toprim domain-containing protein [Theionarchaea archaeon]MBU7039306.1 toprim domain-containing protein [Theionarchaea archaeon]
MNDRERVLHLIESLKNEPEAVILVEGHRDYLALRKLGIEHTIEKISGKRILDDLSFLEGKNVILLTDFDSAGRRLFKTLRTELEVMGFKPNLYYWQQLQEALRGEITQIEELSRFAQDFHQVM